MKSALPKLAINSVAYYNYSRHEILNFIPENITKVLDVGCGSGNFSNLLKSKKNVEVWGVEICKEAADQAKTKLDKIIVGDFENSEIDLPQNYFDCIIYNDVLEHFKDPWGGY